MSAMKRFVKQLFDRPPHTVRNSKVTNRTRLACEGLEVREMPAGLTAVLRGSDLLVTGTDGADSIVVRQDTGRISVNGASIMKNGVAVSSVLAPQVAKVQVDARGGNDSVWLVDLSGAGTAADKARAVIVNAGDGNDFVATGLGQNIVYGGNGVDDLEGYKPGSANTFYGEAGDDVIDVSRVTDPQISVLDGGDGNDAIHGSQGADRIYGGAGNDYLRGNAGDDRIEGGAGKNVIDGGKGADVFYSTGTDTFTNRESADRVVTPSAAPAATAPAPQTSAQPAVVPAQPALAKPAASAVPAATTSKVASSPVASATTVQSTNVAKASVPTVPPTAVSAANVNGAGAAVANTKLAPLDAQMGLASVSAMMPSLTASAQNPLGLNVGLPSLSAAMMPTATGTRNALGVLDAGLPAVPTQPSMGADPRLAADPSPREKENANVSCISGYVQVMGTAGALGGAVVGEFFMDGVGAGEGIVFGGLGGGLAGIIWGIVRCEPDESRPSAPDTTPPDSSGGPPRTPVTPEGGSSGGDSSGGSSGGGEVIDGGEIDDDVIDGGEIDKTPNPEDGGGTVSAGMAKTINAITASTATAQPANQKNPSNVSQPSPDSVAPADAIVLGTLVSLPNVTKVQQQTNPNPEGSMVSSGALAGLGSSGPLGGVLSDGTCAGAPINPMVAMADLGQRNQVTIGGKTLASSNSTSAAPTVTVSAPVSVSTAIASASIAKPATTSVPTASVAKATPVASAPVAATAPAVDIARASVVASPIVVSTGTVVLSSSAAMAGLGGSGLRLR